MNNIKNLVEVNNIVGEPIVTPDGQTAAASGRQTASNGPHTGRGFSTQPTSPILSIANPFMCIPAFQY